MIPTTILNEKTLRRLFHDWHSIKLLGQNPLAGLRSVELRCQEAGLDGAIQGKGLALQKVIRDAVRSLVPEAGSPNPRERCWRPYIILTEQFLCRQSPEVVREQLFVSKGTYYGEQARALEMLIAALQTFENECTKLSAQPLGLNGHTAPFLVPPRMGHPLVGREQCLQAIKSALFQGEGRSVAVLRGLPGVGKTTLALEAAYDPEVRQYFEDGILWAGLGLQPTLPALMSAWADALHIPMGSFDGNSSLAERATLLRTHIGQRQMLLIVDDVWQVEAALALKVGGPNCAHLLTTRLPEVALSFAGGNMIHVHELEQEDGLSLLEAIAPHAVAADRDLAFRLVQVVGSLPLALILMGRFLQKHSDSLQIRRVQDALQKLQAADARLKLDQLQAPLESNPNFPFGAPISLQAAIDLSVTSLPPTARTALLALACFPPKPNTFSEAAALAVTMADSHSLDVLVDCGLLETVPPDRYMLHQTISDYAALQRADNPAFRRMVDYFADFSAAFAHNFIVLDQEINNLFAAGKLAIELGLQAAFVRLALDIYPFLETRGWYTVAEGFLEDACAAANEIDDHYSKMITLGKLGDFEIKRGRFKSAQRLLERSLALEHEAGSNFMQGDNLFNLGLACAYQGDVTAAVCHLEQCLQVQRATDNTRGEAYALNALGFAMQECGRYTQAQVYLDDALALSVRIGERRNEGWVHYNLGQVFLSTGKFARAKEHCDQCLQIYRSLGDRRGEGWILYETGRIFRQQGEYCRAENLFSQALQILSGLGDTMGEAYALLNLGLIQMDIGNPAKAQAYYNRALAGFVEIDCQTGESQVYHLLANLYRRCGDFLAAQALLERSLQIYRQTPYPRGECTHQAHLAMIEAHLGSSKAALAHSDAALRIAAGMHALPISSYVFTCRGHTMRELSQYSLAEDAFRQALAIDRDLGQLHLAVDPLAGLASIAYRHGSLLQAKGYVEEILASLENGMTCDKQPGFLQRVDQPAAVFLTCFHILDTFKDARAETVIRSGLHFIETWANNLCDENQKALFLNLPHHREILEKFG